MSSWNRILKASMYTLTPGRSVPSPSGTLSREYMNANTSNRGGWCRVNRQELIRAVSGDTGLTRQQSESALDSLVYEITKGVRTGVPIRITGFGTFKLRERKARSGRNPQTGAPVYIRASKGIGFSPGVQSKTDLNSSAVLQRPTPAPVAKKAAPARKAAPKKAARKAGARKVVKKAGAKKVVKRALAKKRGAKKVGANKVVKKAPAKKRPARKAPAKKAPARRRPAKRRTISTGPRAS